MGLVGGIYGCMWLQCIGVVSGWCCKEVYRYPHNTVFTLLIPGEIFNLFLTYRELLYFNSSKS